MTITETKTTKEYLDEKYPEKERQKITYLDISSKDLRGELELKGFVNLEKLDCSNNKLTRLDLDDCKNLVELTCSSNEFTSLNFLKSVSRLERLWISNNKKFPPQTLKELPPLKKLECLDINSCSFEGSLKPLKSLIRLEWLFITNTNLSEGLEHLPASCKELYSDSEKIMEELDKSKCLEGEEKNKHYNLDKWRIDKQNNMIASIIPLERLYVIRGNMRQFLKKWGIKKKSDNTNDDNTHWYSKLLTKKEINNISELQSPEELYKFQLAIYGTQFLGRGSAVAGAVLTFQNYSAIGGGILAVYPITELAVSKLEKSLEVRESKWKEFLADTDGFLDSYHELMGILAQFKIEGLKKGGVNKALKDLNEKIKEFLEYYDEDKSGEIDVEEIIMKKNRDKLTQDLNEEKDGKVRGIIGAIGKLETEIISYRQSSYYEIDEKVTDEPDQVNAQQSKVNSEVAIDLDEYYLKEKETGQDNQETIAQIEQHPKKD